MPTPNPHTFPLVAYPGLAPELDIRSGMSGWEPYAQPAPSDRLLPFVLARRISFRNAVWISCIWIEHADTGARIVTLVPTGSLALPTPVPALGVVFNKLPDPANDTEYFTYDAAFIPDLAAALPCGVPLRLIVDNAYQSPRFFAIAPAADLPARYLPLEWHHNGPLQGVPYGSGFRQRLYIDNGSLQDLDHRVVQESTPDPNGGPTRIDSMSVFRQVAFTVEPTPSYLAQAVGAAIAVKTLLADGQPWRLVNTKTAPSGEGGRWSLVGTLEDEAPLLRRGCTGPILTADAFPANYVPRGWRCGDASDTAPDFVFTGAYSCELDPGSGVNTGYVLEQQQDLNPNSSTYGQTRDVLSTNQDLSRCPLNQRYTSTAQTAYAARNNCGPGYTAFGLVPFTVAAGYATSLISQQDADQIALAFAGSQAQANANLYGACSPGGRVNILNQAVQDDKVLFDLERTDTTGDLLVYMECEAEVTDGTTTTTRQFTNDYTILAGAFRVTGVSLPYGGQQLIAFHYLRITRVDPPAYTF